MVRKRLLFFLVLLSILMSPVLASSAVLWDQPITTTNTKRGHRFLTQTPHGLFTTGISLMTSPMGKPGRFPQFLFPAASVAMVSIPFLTQAQRIVLSRELHRSNGKSTLTVVGFQLAPPRAQALILSGSFLLQTETHKSV